MRHQYGISIAESQTFLLVKRPSAAMSEEKRLPFAGSFDESNNETDYELFAVFTWADLFKAGLR